MNVMDKDLILIVGGALVVAVVLHGMWLTWRARRDRLPVELATDVPKTDHEDGDILGPPRVVGSATEQGTLRLWNPAGDALAGTRAPEAPLAARKDDADTAGAPAPADVRTEPAAAPIFSRADAMEPAPVDAPPLAPIVPDDSAPLVAVAREEVAAIRAQTSGRTAGLEAAALAVADIEPGLVGELAQDEVRTDVVAEPVPAVAGGGVLGGIGAVPLEVEVPPPAPVGLDGGVGPAEPVADLSGVGSDGVRGADEGTRSSAGGDGAVRERTRARRSEPRDTDAVGRQDEEIFVINVLARNGAAFNGADLFEVFMRNALKFRDMNIFHRLDPVSGAVRFSVSNAVEPGIFDLSDMASLETPGVSLFFRLPGPEQPGEVLDDMLCVARDIGKSLGGDLKDENMSVLTGQTLSHFKQRMAEFSRKRMSMRARHG